MTTDIETLRTGVQNVLFVTIVGLMQMICSGICMAYYNIVLFSVILVMAPLLWIINQYFHKKISATSRELQESFSRVTASLVESVKGIRVTQGFVREDINAGIFRRLVQDHSSYNLKASRNTAIYIPLLELNSQFFIASILMIGGYGTLSPDWDMPVADLISFFFLANLFFNPISQLGLRFTDALSAMAGAERVFRLLDAEPEWTDASDAQTIDSMKGQLEFRNVTFAYEPENPVLHDINFKAEPGQTIALVGHTGCGKTSIINLISKFYLPTSGEILIDGKEIRNIKSASLRSQMGVVLQNNFIFSGTVLDNIRLGKLDATDEEVIDAVRQLNCLDLIGAMTEGIRTKVTEKGGGLSLGQQQLICFARAFLADPRILILDEATSSIDTITEARLQESMSTLLAGRTSIVVAHRLSTIRSADLILVLDHGRIVERGTHTELLSLDGTYSNLYRQFIDSDI
jgi:ATP-binding cassette subfamily B protein